MLPGRRHNAGATAALTTQEDGVMAAVAEWQRRRNTLLAELKGLPVVPPKGGWSLLINVKELGLEAEQAANLLFEKAAIAATPMTNWGSDRSSDYIRFVYANEPVRRLQGLRERIQAAWNV